MRTAIVGAGAAGLSLASMLDGDVTIFEKESTPGGLCRSTMIDGFTFDQGPHILGGIPEAVEWVKQSTGIEFVEGTTRNVGWVNGEFVPHPFEDDVIGRQYMRKMWKVDDLASLSANGLSAQAGRKPGGVKTFLYPKTGGYQAITDAWAKQLEGKIEIEFDVETRYWWSDYDRVVWTAPINARYNWLWLETVGFEGKPPDLTAVYLPDWKPVWHRLSFPSAFSPNNAPEGCFSVQGEMSWMEHSPHSHDLLRICSAIGIDNKPTFRHQVEVPFAYPVPLHVRFSEVPRGTIYHGRTGSHTYLNLDGVVKQSMDLAAELNT